ncbi:unnamed protein product, partial [Mesorhabditis spiculigera]
MGDSQELAYGRPGRRLTADQEFANEMMNFLRAAFHQLLYQYGCYPSSSFIEKNFEQLPVKRCTSKDVVEYCEAQVELARNLLKRRKLEGVMIRFMDKYETPILEYDFELRNQVMHKLDTSWAPMGYRDYLRHHYREALGQICSLSLPPALLKKLKAEEHRAEFHLFLNPEVRNVALYDSRAVVVELANFMIRPKCLENDQQIGTHDYTAAFQARYTRNF